MATETVNPPRRSERLSQNTLRAFSAFESKQPSTSTLNQPKMPNPTRGEQNLTIPMPEKSQDEPDANPASSLSQQLEGASQRATLIVGSSHNGSSGDADASHRADVLVGNDEPRIDDILAAANSGSGGNSTRPPQPPVDSRPGGAANDGSGSTNEPDRTLFPSEIEAVLGTENNVESAIRRMGQLLEDVRDGTMDSYSVDSLVNRASQLEEAIRKGRRAPEDEIIGLREDVQVALDESSPAVRIQLLSFLSRDFSALGSNPNPELIDNLSLANQFLDLRAIYPELRGVFERLNKGVDGIGDSSQFADGAAKASGRAMGRLRGELRELDERRVSSGNSGRQEPSAEEQDALSASSEAPPGMIEPSVASLYAGVLEANPNLSDPDYQRTVEDLRVIDAALSPVVVGKLASLPRNGEGVIEFDEGDFGQEAAVERILKAQSDVLTVEIDETNEEEGKTRYKIVFKPTPPSPTSSPRGGQSSARADSDRQQDEVAPTGSAVVDADDQDQRQKRRAEFESHLVNAGSRDARELVNDFREHIISDLYTPAEVDVLLDQCSLSEQATELLMEDIDVSIRNYFRLNPDMSPGNAEQAQLRSTWIESITGNPLSPDEIAHQQSLTEEEYKLRREFEDIMGSHDVSLNRGSESYDESLIAGVINAKYTPRELSGLLGRIGVSWMSELEERTLNNISQGVQEVFAQTEEGAGRSGTAMSAEEQRFINIWDNNEPHVNRLNALVSQEEASDGVQDSSNDDLEKAIEEMRARVNDKLSGPSLVEWTGRQLGRLLHRAKNKESRGRGLSREDPQARVLKTIAETTTLIGAMLDKKMLTANQALAIQDNVLRLVQSNQEGAASDEVKGVKRDLGRLVVTSLQEAMVGGDEEKAIDLIELADTLELGKRIPQIERYIEGVRQELEGDEELEEDLLM